MPDKKLTDNEIIKALEICSGSENICKNCYLLNYSMDYNACMAKLITDAKDLITRQQSEIENLKVENQSLRGAANSLKMHYEEAQAEIERLQNILLAFMSALGKVENVEDIESITQIPIMWELNKQFRAEIKSEAVKEFAEKLKENSEIVHLFSIHTGDHYMVDIDDIDYLVKEMVGE